MFCHVDRLNHQIDMPPSRASRSPSRLDRSKAALEITWITDEYPRTLWTLGLGEKLSCGVEDVDENSEVPWHQHDAAEEMLFCTAGSGKFYLGDDDPVDFKPGVMILVPAKTKHRIVNSSSKRPLSFAWALSPPQTPQQFRARGIANTAAMNCYIEATYLISLGILVLVAPRTAHAIMDTITFTAPLTPLGDELLWLRLFGALGVAYIGFWYAVAGYSNHTAFFKCSIITRCIVLPTLHVGLVLTGCTNTAWLEAAVPVDFLLGLHMWRALRLDGEASQPPAEEESEPWTPLGPRFVPWLFPKRGLEWRRANARACREVESLYHPWEPERYVLHMYCHHWKASWKTDMEGTVVTSYTSSWLARFFIMVLAFAYWVCLVPLATKIKSVVGAIAYSFTEFGFTKYIERGGPTAPVYGGPLGYTSLAQFTANVLYVGPVLLNGYSHVVTKLMSVLVAESCENDSNDAYGPIYVMFFPFNVWLYEALLDFVLKWFYGRNVAWRYDDYADTFCNSACRLGHAPFWWLLGVVCLKMEGVW